MDDEKLIEMVEKYKPLYDPYDKNYLNFNKKDKCWADISKQLGHNVTTLKKRWTSLRGMHRRALKKASNLAPGQAKQWRFEKEMAFLQRYATEDNISSANDNMEEKNYENPSEEECLIKIEEEELNVNDIPSPSRSSSRNSYSTPRQTLNQSNNKDFKVISADLNNSRLHKENANESFFNSMCNIVQGLPDYQQALIRSQVARIVLDADLNFQTEMQIKRITE